MRQLQRKLAADVSCTSWHAVSFRNLRPSSRLLAEMSPAVTPRAAVLNVFEVSAMARSSWDGFLKLSLISIPVRAFNSAAPGRGEVHFHQLHKGCGQRIQYKKSCPTHGEISKDEIISGYEISKGQYVEVPRDELNQLRAEDEQSIEIDAFTPLAAVAPVYFSGRTFYLAPDGPAGEKPYALLRRVMADKGVQAIAHMVLSGHEEPVLIRPVGDLLEMTVLLYESQVKAPGSVIEAREEPKMTAQEMKLANALVEESIVEKFDFSELKDHYTERVTAFLETKAAGKPIHRPTKEKAPAVINLMEALKKSLHETQAKKATPRGRKKTG